MIVNIIAAMSERNGLIGVDNALPWSLPSDMARFKLLTKSSVVIMGRKTYESIPKKFRPLTGRVNIVLTRNKRKFYAKNDCQEVGKTLVAVGSVKEALKRAAMHQSLDHNLSSSVWVIGGEQVYKKFLDENYIDFLYLTVVDDFLTGYSDEMSFFPLTISGIDESGHWTILREDLIYEPRDDYQSKYRIYVSTKATRKVKLGLLRKLAYRAVNYISLP